VDNNCGSKVKGLEKKKNLSMNIVKRWGDTAATGAILTCGNILSDCTSGKRNNKLTRNQTTSDGKHRKRKK